MSKTERPSCTDCTKWTFSILACSFHHCDTQQPRQDLTAQRFQFDFLNLLFHVQVNGQNVGVGFFTKELLIVGLGI